MAKRYFAMIDGKHVELNPDSIVPEEDPYEMLCIKLADIRNLFDESDMEAEGHGMEDMISDPYAVACYAERKLLRMISDEKLSNSLLKNREREMENLKNENKRLIEELENQKNPFKDIEKWAKVWASTEKEKMKMEQKGE